MSTWLDSVRHASLALVACGALLGGSGCYKATFVEDPKVVAGREHDPWTAHFLWGLAGHEYVEVTDYCPDGKVQQIRTGGNFGTAVVGGLTLGIYSPRKVYIT